MIPKIKSDLPRNILFVILFFCIAACGSRPMDGTSVSDSSTMNHLTEEFFQKYESDLVHGMLVSPEHPRPGEHFRVVITGGRKILEANIQVSGPSGEIALVKSRSGEGLPFWQIGEFVAQGEGTYQVTTDHGKLNFTVGENINKPMSGSVWESRNGWNKEYEALYSAWINALFQNSKESESWKALN